MDRQGAESALIASAIVVGAVHGYRVAHKDKGLRPLGQWLTGFGATFFILALLAQAAPAVGGYGAILVAIADFIDNGVPLMNDIANVEGAASAQTGTSAPAPTKPTLHAVG